VTTGLVTTPAALRHDTGPGHAERVARLTAVLERLEASGLAARTARLEAPPAPEEALLAVHDAAYLEQLRRVSAAGGGRLDPDTIASAGSHEAAVRTAGGVLAACERVVSGEWRNAFVASRPPGHHAERDRAMGFCLVNHAVVAARHARSALGLERVAILDWDVHHGNGTQHLTEDDPTVFYGSLHQAPLYPGTGAADERGSGAGEGSVLNLPLPAGAGDAAFLGAFRDELLPAVRRFDPELVIVSAGFDAHAADPLAQLEVSTDAYGKLTRLVTDLADACCGGRVVSLLEGGYDLAALADSVEVHLEALLEAGERGGAA
jgi:acetoin utilization deacetylase AcuC-like enzyme